MPEQFRDLASHGRQIGVIRAMGPLAFTYKTGIGDELARHPVAIGDCVVFKWGAGTTLPGMQGLAMDATTGGWRYLSSFSDIAGWLSAADIKSAGIDIEKLCQPDEPEVEATKYAGPRNV